jgi:adenosylcobinamide-phosphate synthase
MSAALALLAMLIELCIGYPERLTRAIGHPVTWIGDLIERCDRHLNREMTSGLRRFMGVLALVVLLGVIGAIAFVAQSLLLRLPYGFVAVAVLASTMVAQRSLHWYVANVASALDKDGLDAGRAAVSHIVGRDTGELDRAGVARAAIESLAENFSDAVVAPVFWLLVAGLPGIALYKAINTADSMIGHRTPRHADFGWATAKLDDLVNLPASRLAALLLIAASLLLRQDASTSRAWHTVRRDAARHRSPNAGYPEAAMAGALGLSLAGPRTYGGVGVVDAFMGDGRRDLSVKDIGCALALYRTADAILVALVAALAAISIALG